MYICIYTYIYICIHTLLHITLLYIALKHFILSHATNDACLLKKKQAGLFVSALLGVKRQIGPGLCSI